MDLERCVPAFLTWIANKLSRGASQHYLSAFDVAIETWRCLVLLAIEDSTSAQQVSSAAAWLTLRPIAQTASSFLRPGRGSP